MRRMLAVVAFLFLATSSFADDRLVKRDLIRDLLKVLDGKALTQSMIDVMLARDEDPDPPESVLRELSAADRKRYEELLKQRADAKNHLREQVFARIDYASYTEDVFAPMFDKTFSAAELKDLIAFFKTPAGQKTARVFPELARSMMKNAEKLEMLVADIPDQTSPELWSQTMAILRMVATATEAYATDTNKYPNVSSYEDLAPILTPTYIKTLPEKDAWGTPLRYAVSADGQHYRFVSAGADQQFEWNSQQVSASEAHASDSLDADIIFQDGVFVQYPAVAKSSLQ
jgi:hypothetical protein